MELNIGKEVAKMQKMTIPELRLRYYEVFGEETRAGNKAWFVKRIAWRLQSQAEGDLSERAPTGRGVGQRRRRTDESTQGQAGGDWGRVRYQDGHVRGHRG